MDTINFYNKHSKTDAYTQKTYPLHRNTNTNTNFDDENGIVTWADEIDYGKVENFGWPGSNTTIDNSYQSLLEALDKNFRFLYNEIQALKNDGSISIELTKANYQGATNYYSIHANVLNGNSNTTSWKISQKPGTTAWFTDDTYGTIPPFGISNGAYNPNPVNTSVQNASSIIAGPWIGPCKELYDPFTISIEQINILNGANNHFNGNGGSSNSKSFKAILNSEESKTYTAVVTATNNGVTSTTDITRTVAGDSPEYIWRIYRNTEGSAPMSRPNGENSTCTYSGITFTIKNFKAQQVTVECSENNTDSAIEFYVGCRADYDDGTSNTKYVKCILDVKQSEPTETQYYWYGGQTDPEIDTNIVTENGVSGWRLVTDGYEYNSTINPIYDEEYKSVVYCALPKDGTVKIKDDQGTVYNPLQWPVLKDITFNGIEYTVYKADDIDQFSGYTIFK